MSYEDSPTFVTGVGRCGTSLIAGILHHLGVHMGNELQLPDEHNPHGYFEDLEFTSFHEELLQRVSRDEMMARAKMRQLISSRKLHNRYRPWGVKDPRLTYFISEYHNVLPFAKWIISLRDEEQVLSSMQATYFIDRESCKRVMSGRLEVMNTQIDNTYGLCLIMMNFRKVLENPSGTIDVLVHHLGLLPTNEQLVAARKFVQPRTSEHSRIVPAARNIHGLVNVNLREMPMVPSELFTKQGAQPIG